MKYELRKIFANPFVALLLLVLIVVNACTYYRYCTAPIDGTFSITMRDVQKKYQEHAKGVDLRAEYDTINALLFEDNAVDWDDTTAISAALDEMERNKVTLARIEAAEKYPESLSEIQNSYLVMLRLDSFNDAGSYSYRTLQKSAQTYEALGDIMPEVSFSGGIELLSDWRITDVFLLVFALAAGLILITQERNQGYLSLLRPTKKGHAHLYIRKFLAMMAIMLMGIVLLYGANFAITGFMFGFGNLARPVQSIYGFTFCPLHLTVGGYLLSFFAGKVLWAMAVGAVFFLLCSCFVRVGLITAVALALGGASYLLGQQENLWLQALSLVHKADIAALYQGCIFLNLFSWPVWQLPVIAVFWMLLLGISFALGLVLYCRRPAITAVKSTGGRKGLCVGLHTNLAAHECRKLLVMRGGALVLMLLAVVQVASYWDFDEPDDLYYRQYAEVLAGLPSAEKDAFLEAESAYFAEIHEQILYFSQLYSDNEEIRLMILSPLERKLIPEVSFEQAKVQYESLENDMVFLYTTGYNRLFQSRGVSDDLLNTGKLFVAMIITMAGAFAAEYETGMNVLFVTAGHVKRVWRLKLTQGVVFLLLGMGIAYLPQYLAVIRNYGLPLITVAAYNLPIFSSFPGWLPIWGVFLLVGIVRLGIGLLALFVIFALSSKTKSTVTTVLISLATLLLPLLLAKLFLQ